MKRLIVVAACLAGVLLFCGNVFAGSLIKVAGIYTQPIQQKWDACLHKALQKAADAGEIEYVYSEKVSNTDYIRVLREYSEKGVDLVVGEAFGISRDARKVARDYPKVAYLMGDTFGPAEPNLSVFDNYIHEPCYLMGMIAGKMTKTNKIGMVGGYPIGEVEPVVQRFHGRCQKGQSPRGIQGLLYRFPGMIRQKPRNSPMPRLKQGWMCFMPNGQA